MTASSYPKPVADVVATATDICRHQKRIELVELLENAHAYFDEINYDNWNGGTTTWALRLEVPTHLFAAIHPRLAESETELLQKLDYLSRLFPNDPLGEVTITPLTSAEISIGQRLAPSDSVSLANSITRALLKSNQVHGTMRRALVEAFENANIVVALERLKKLILEIDSFNDDEKERLRNACVIKSRIAGAQGIKEAIYETVGAPREVSAEIDEIPF